MKIGILAFQGDVLEHTQALKRLGAESCEVRSVHDLQRVDALIIPGGESTVITKFLQETGLDDAITRRHQNEQFPIFGTCAGAIVLAKGHLSLMDIVVERNAYGPQSESCTADITLALPEGEERVSGVFIRAPKIVSVGNSVEVLGRYQGDPVVCRQGNVLVSTFHPELLKGVSCLHKYFIGHLEQILTY